MSEEDQRALSGIRIVDFSQVLAGPFASQQLIQLGAEVIKIEPPEGDMTRSLIWHNEHGTSPSFLAGNFGKRSIRLDLKHPDARTVVDRLVAQADVVLENFKPGTMARLGLEYERLKAIKPDLIFASVSGFGQSGPLSEQPAFDGAIQAFSGMMSVSGDTASGPLRTGYFAVDMSTALNAAFAISAALLRRERTGLGQRLDVSMLETALFMQAPQLSNYCVSGQLPELIGNMSPTRQPTCNVFQSKDGFIQIVALKEKHVQRLFDVIGQGADYARFNNPDIRLRETKAVNAILQPAIARQPTRYWLEALADAGIPVSPIQDYGDLVAHPQVHDRAAFVQQEYPPQSGELVDVVRAAHQGDKDRPQASGVAPTLGEHTLEVLDELGFNASDIARFRDGGLI